MERLLITTALTSPNQGYIVAAMRETRSAIELYLAFQAQETERRIRENNERGQRQKEAQRAAFVERASRHGPVPIFEYEDERGVSLLVAPVCPGPTDGTMVVRWTVLTGWCRNYRETVPLHGGGQNMNIVDKFWAATSAHKRLAMFAAVKDRTPKGGPR